MNRAQVGHVFRKEVAQLRRNKEAIRILLVVPFIQMIAFGYAATTDVKDIPFSLVDSDRTAASRALVERFTGSGFFRLVEVADRPEVASERLVLGTSDLVLVIPAGYGRALERRERAEVQVLADGTDSNSSMKGLAYAAQIVGEETAARFERIEGPGVPGRIAVEPRVWYNPDLRSRWYMVPAVLAMVLMTVLLTLSSMAVVREREIGTMEQLIVTPLDPGSLLVGKLAPYAIVGLVEIAITSAVTFLWFKVPLRGSLLDLVGMGMLFVVVTIALGLLVSTMARTQQQAMMASMFFVMTPMVYLSGFLFPIENMPLPVQAVTFVIPLRWFADVVRGVILKGSTLETLWPNALALGAFAGGLLFVAARRFRKRLD